MTTYVLFDWEDEKVYVSPEFTSDTEFFKMYKRYFLIECPIYSDIVTVNDSWNISFFKREYDSDTELYTSNPVNILAEFDFR